MVNHNHRMWSHLQSAGISEQALGWFLDHPCPPDIIGINHYLTSERYIDETLERYPSVCIGSNGQDRYADVEAIRVLKNGTCGIYGILQEAWERYGRPLAVTEVHLGCTREEQMRWLLEVWESAHNLRTEGVDVRAVTGWSLFGSYDWNSLLTQFAGHYEPGIFDLRSGAPRPTALAEMMRALAEGRTSPISDRLIEQSDNVLVSPTYVPDLVHACLDLLIDGESGIWHVYNQGRVTWSQLVRIAAERVGLTAFDSNYNANDVRFDGRTNGHQSSDYQPAEFSKRDMWRPRASQHSPGQSFQTDMARITASSQSGSERRLLLQALEAAVDCYIRDCGIDWASLEPAQGNEHVRRTHTVGHTHRRVHKSLR